MLRTPFSLTLNPSCRRKRKEQRKGTRRKKWEVRKGGREEEVTEKERKNRAGVEGEREKKDVL